jgi:hypothetical protein
MEPIHSAKPAQASPGLNHKLSSSQQHSADSNHTAPPDHVDPVAYDVLARLVQQHKDYDRQLRELLAKPVLSEEDHLEEVRLKKLKLRQKDAIERLRYEMHLYTGHQLEH